MQNPPKEQKNLRLALIGASAIAAKVLPFIREVKEIHVVGVAAERKNAAEEFAKAHSIPKSYSSYQDCLSDSAVDAVYISNLNCDHAKTIKISLLAGKHVLCEKPLVLTAADAEELFGLAASRGLILLEGFMYRFHPQIVKLKEIIAAGGIGDIRSIRARFSFILYDLEHRPMRATSHARGGALNDVGCYLVDFINSIVRAGQLPVEIHKTHRADPSDAFFDFETTAILKYKNSITVELSACMDTPSLNQWEVSGTSGSVSALRFDPQGSESVPLYHVNESSQAELIECPSVNNFTAEFKNFAWSCMQITTPHISAAESILNARLLEALSPFHKPASK